MLSKEELELLLLSEEDNDMKTELTNGKGEDEDE